MVKKKPALKRIERAFLDNNNVNDVATAQNFPVLEQLGIDMRVFSKQGNTDYRVSWTSYHSKRMFFLIRDDFNNQDQVFTSQAHYLLKIFKDTVMVFHQEQLREYLKKHWEKFSVVYSEKYSCSGVLVDVEELEREVKTYSELPFLPYKQTEGRNKIALLPVTRESK